MIEKPNLQESLYGFDTIFNEIALLYKNNKLPNKILLSGPKGSGKSTLAYHIINYILSSKEDFSYNSKDKLINKNNKSFILLNNKTHPNFFLVDLKNDKKYIEISQTREMINYVNKSNFNQLPKFILIDNVEHLNKNSLNSLLKIIEEPNLNVFFILIHDSNKRLVDTLRSRCLIFKINHTFDQTMYITNKLLNANLLNIVNHDLINYYLSPGNYLNLISFSKINNLDLTKYNIVDFLSLLINEKFYIKNDFIKSYIFVLIELYFLKIFANSINKSEVINLYTKFIHKINDTVKYNLDHETLFLEFKSKVLNG